jgi:antirestriction protein ArdC
MRNRADIYQEVTDSIIRQLENGVRPWAKSWQAAGPGFVLPVRASGERYRGINVLLLWGAAEEKGFSSPQWFTFKQAQEMGASVRKGEKAAKVVYFNRVSREVETDNGDREEVEIPFLKAYAVFNAEQIDGLPDTYQRKPLPREDAPSPIPNAEDFFARVGVEIRHGGDRAYCSRATGHIQMPHLADFVDAESYYATLAHETVHWSGHEGRLDREFGKRFGDQAYAAEELVAEIGAAFLAADLGLYVEPREDHTSYLDSWLKVLKADKRAIFTAASKAQAAADFIHESAKEAAPRPVVANMCVSAQIPVEAASGPENGPDGDPDPQPPKGGRKPSRKATSNYPPVVRMHALYRGVAGARLRSIERKLLTAGITDLHRVRTSADHLIIDPRTTMPDLDFDGLPHANLPLGRPADLRAFEDEDGGSHIHLTE